MGYHPPALSRALLLVAATAALLALPGCRTATAASPDASARAYAQALREGRLDDAWGHVSTTQREEGLDEQSFRARYEDDGVRRARADEVEAALAEGTLRADGLTLVREDDSWLVREESALHPASRALERFLQAAEASDFEAAWAQLSSALRARYTPSQLAADFQAEPQAKARLERARASLAQGPRVEGDEAFFDLGEGRAVRLVREGDGWRVAALE